MYFWGCVHAQLCPSLCNPMDCSPPGSSVHGIFPGKNTGVGCGIFSGGALVINPTVGTCQLAFFTEIQKVLEKTFFFFLTFIYVGLVLNLEVATRILSSSIVYTIKYSVGEISLMWVTSRKDYSWCISMSSHSGTAPSNCSDSRLTIFTLGFLTMLRFYSRSYWEMAYIPAFCNYFTLPPASWGRLCCLPPSCQEYWKSRKLHAGDPLNLRTWGITEIPAASN